MEVNMTKLSGKHFTINMRTKKYARIHTRAERFLVESLIEVEAENIHKLLGYRSMFLYATKELELSEAVALALISVARKAKILPALREAIAKGKIPPSKASRMAAHINQENAEEMINFASTHTTREIDFEMARRNPKAKPHDRIKPISEDMVQITVTISKKAFDDLTRAQSVIAQKGKPSTIGDAIETSLEHYLNTQDPVRKAKRANVKKVCLHRVKTNKRTPLTAAEGHVVNARDEGRCTFQDQNGHRCNSDRWVHIHHIIPVSQGGSNDPENLTTLCSFHHDLVHQMSFEEYGNSLR